MTEPREDEATGKPGKLRAWGARFLRGCRPLSPLIAVVLVCVFALPDAGGGGELYPLSSFPMYSRNKSKSYLVYLTDGQGGDLPSESLFGVRTSVLKKDYNRELGKLKKELGMSDYEMTALQKQPAGVSCLGYLVEQRAPEEVAAAIAGGLGSIRLVDRRLYRRENYIAVEDSVVAEWFFHAPSDAAAKEEEGAP